MLHVGQIINTLQKGNNKDDDDDDDDDDNNGTLILLLNYAQHHVRGWGSGSTAISMHF